MDNFLGRKKYIGRDHGSWKSKRQLCKGGEEVGGGALEFSLFYTGL